jgi:hypothetical protein
MIGAVQFENSAYSDDAFGASSNAGIVASQHDFVFFATLSFQQQFYELIAAEPLSQVLCVFPAQQSDRRRFGV